MTFAEVVETLRRAGCVFAEDEATLLIDTAGGAELAALVARRAAGEPLEQVVGWADSCGLRITLAPGVFVPRSRTALLARTAGSVAPPDGVVVDLCCGSGAVAAAVRALAPRVDLHAADLLGSAVACASGNLGEQVYQGDLYDALPEGLRGKVDVVVANAPYVPSAAIALMPAEARDHEPRETLDGGDDGLTVIRRIVGGAEPWLAPGGHVLFECGEAQVAAALASYDGTGLVPQVVRDDLGGIVILAS